MNIHILHNFGDSPQNPSGDIPQRLCCIHETLFDDVPWRKDEVDEDVRFADGLMYPSDRPGLGIELNFSALSLTDESRDIMLRPYRIAKEEGCRFYLGSDAHHPAALGHAPENFAKIAELLALDDSHKFVI